MMLKSADQIFARAEIRPQRYPLLENAVFQRVRYRKGKKDRSKHFSVQIQFAGRRYAHYRCQRIFKRLTDWLREHGVGAKGPLHALRKEFGSQICDRHGIYAASRALHRRV